MVLTENEDAADVAENEQLSERLAREGAAPHLVFKYGEEFKVPHPMVSLDIKCYFGPVDQLYYEDVPGRYRAPIVTGVDSATQCELSNIFGNTWRLAFCLLLMNVSALCCSSTFTTFQLGASSERRFCMVRFKRTLSR
jgi:hypothetical protein